MKTVFLFALHSPSSVMILTACGYIKKMPADKHTILMYGLDNEKRPTENKRGLDAVTGLKAWLEKVIPEEKLQADDQVILTVDFNFGFSGYDVSVANILKEIAGIHKIMLVGTGGRPLLEMLPAGLQHSTVKSLIAAEEKENNNRKMPQILDGNGILKFAMSLAANQAPASPAGIACASPEPISRVLVPVSPQSDSKQSSADTTPVQTPEIWPRQPPPSLAM